MLSKFHFNIDSDLVKMTLPGPRSKALLKKQSLYEGKNVSYPKGIPLAFSKAKGSIVEDVDGNQYIDLFSSCGVLSLGHNNQEILNCLKDSPEHILQAVDFPTEIRVSYVEKLLSTLESPLHGNFKVNFGGPTGSDAVESAIKLARINTGRHSIIAFKGGYHGMTMGALSVTSKKSHREQSVPLIPGVHFAPFCTNYRGEEFKESIETFREMLENPHSGVDKPAAIIVEPIQGEGGTYIPPEGWLEKIVEIARKNEVLVIFDEIQAGFFRTGKMFSFEHTKAIPDIITMSKGISGVGHPLSLILYNKKLDTWKAGTHIGTFRGNQLAFIAAKASLEFIEKYKISEYVRDLGRVMILRLGKLKDQYEFVGDVRGLGLFVGIEYVKNKSTKEPDSELAKRVRKMCYERGLLVEVGGYYDNVIRFLPSLIITEEILERGLDIFCQINEDLT